MFEMPDARERDRVRAAFEAVPRRGFLRHEWRADAGVDAPLSIGHGQTNSQPTTVANMLALLAVPRGARVLDVGSGSGWTTALLAHLIGAGGQVVGTELVPELRVSGAANLARFLDTAAEQPASASAADERAGGFASAEIRLAIPGVLGAPYDAPFDRILVSAEPKTLPNELVTQLAPDGVMVIPVAGTMLRVTRDEHGDAVTSRHGVYRFVPLR